MNELRSASASGLSLYAHILNASGQRWNGSAFETYASGHYSLYTIALTEQGSSGIYVGSFPTAITDSGTYEYYTYRRMGASPAEGDPVIGVGSIAWTGTQVDVDVSTLDSAVALITLASIKDYLNIASSQSSEDSVLSFLINATSQAVNDFTSRQLIQKSWTEYHDGSGQSKQLIMSQYPIISVASIYSDTDRAFGLSTLISSSDYYSQNQAGIIQLDWNMGNFIRGKANIKVTYTAGYQFSSVPYSIGLAVKRWVGYHYKRMRSGLHDTLTVSVGDKHTTYMDNEIPKDVRLLLEPHMRAEHSESFSHYD